MASLDTNISTFNLLATPTTVNAFAGASVALNIGNASAAAAFPGGISIPTGKMLSGAGAINMTGTITTAASAYIGDTANVNSTLGLTINQGAADDEILSLKSTDVSHPATSTTEADTFFLVKKADPLTGIAHLIGIRNSGDTALILQGIAITGGTTNKSTAGPGVVDIRAYQSDGGTGITGIGANENIAAFRTGTTTRFILDSDGDSHLGVGTAWTNFDHLDDVATLDALSFNVARADDPIKRKFGEWMLEKRAELERNKLVTFNEDGHHFVNMSKLTMLHTGAIRQLGDAQRQESDLVRNEIAQLKGKLAQLEHRV